MNINYGIVEGLAQRVRGKQERYGRIAARALETIDGVRAILSRECE
jgi:folate-dependent tRNA-U54 methylase TrmFO/GidA